MHGAFHDYDQLFRQARRAKGSLRRAIEAELISGHLDIASATARRFAAAGRELDDLQQVARLGLIKAVRGFDPERGSEFIAYAIPTIAGELKRYLRDSTWVIRPPRYLQDLRTAAVKRAPELAQRLGREPTVRELAEELGEAPEAVAEALNCQSSLRPDSLDCPEAGWSVVESFGSEDSRLNRTEEMLMLRTAICELSPREQQLLYYRYFEEQSQQRIGDRLGMSQMQVSRALAGILVRLQHRLLEDTGATTGESAGSATRTG